LAVRLAGRDLLADLVARQLERGRLEPVARNVEVGLLDLDADAAVAAELCDRRLRVVERLAVEAVLVLDRLDALPLDGSRDDHRRLARHLEGFGVRAVDRSGIVAVDLDRMPPEGLRAPYVRVEVPAVHGL